MAKIHDQHKADREGFVKNDANREGFFELHQRQKGVFAMEKDRLDKYESSATITINSLVRLRVYITLTDLNLGPFINEAKVRVRTAYLTGTRNWHEQYTHDVAEVTTRLSGRSAHIRISPRDAFYFEFATSGKPVIVESIVQLGETIPAYRGCMVGVNVLFRDGVVHTKARILQNKRSVEGTELSLVNRPWQVQLHNEPVAYPRTEMKYGRVRATHTLYESFAPVHPWTGVLLRDTDGPFSTYGIPQLCGPSGTWVRRDVGYDIPYEDGHRSNPVRTAYIRGDADWPRAMGQQVVEDETFGKRKFAIYVDAFNQFTVFPTDAITEINPADPYAQNVPEYVLRRLTPDLPAWAYVPISAAKDYWSSTPDLKKWAVDQPEADWKFNHLGTKAVAILFEREAYSYDSTFWSADASPTQPFTGTKFSTLSSWMGVESNFVQSFSTQTYNPTRYFLAPGIVELEIKITLTGGDINDYTAELVTREVRRPSTSEGANSRWAMFVGYVWHDCPKRTNTNAMVKAGTLVAFDLEYWVRLPDNAGDDADRQVIFDIYNVDTGEEIFSSVGAPILAVDLTTLSFVLRIDAYTVERKYCTNQYLNFPIRHFGAWIVHSGVSKEILYPENTPEDMKLQIAAYAKLNGRQFLTERIAATGGTWFYVPVTTERDGWTDTPINNYREWWAFEYWYDYDKWFAAIDPDLDGFGRVKYKTSGSPPTYPTDGDDTVKWLDAVGGDHYMLFFCDSPRWGWHQYASLMPGYMNIDSYATFFTHPNGTYAFFSDSWVYDRNGLPGDFTNATGPGASSGAGLGTGLDWKQNTLGTYDVSKVEHVIFDRVNFEVRAKNQPTRRKGTSFRELYNKAVKAGVDAETLPDSENILPMELVDMRATFTKEIGNDTNAEHEFLDLKMTWNGADWWYRESGYAHPYADPPSSQQPPIVGTSGNFNNLNTYGYWRTTNFATGSVSRVPGAADVDYPSYWHIRFANPLLIMEK